MPATHRDPDELLTLPEAAGELPRRRGGKRPHVATLHRWCTHGLGGVRLRVVRVGGTRCTTRAWLTDFFERLAQQQGLAPPSAPTPTPAAQRRAHRRAEVQAERLNV